MKCLKLSGNRIEKPPEWLKLKLEKSENKEDLNGFNRYFFGIPLSEIVQNFQNKYDLKQQFYIHEKDSSFREWQDQVSFRLGIEYLVWDKLTVMGGYQLIPTTIRPLNYNYEIGLPTADVFSFGLGLTIFKGRIDLAYQKTWYRETDLYFSRFSYNRFDSSNILLGYTYQM